MYIPMPEKIFSWNDAALVWWFITWRSAVVMVTLTIAVSFIAAYVNVSNLIADLLEWGLIFVGVTLQIFFIKIAINRTYRDFKGPKFRLQATAVSPSPAPISSPATDSSVALN